MGTFDLGAVRRFAERLRGLKDVVVHSHGYKADLYALLAARWAGVPVMTSAHGWTSENRKVRAYEALQAWSWRWFDRVVAVSRSYEAQALARGVPRAKLMVVHNAIRGSYAADADPGAARAAARAALGLAPDAVVVGIVGRLGIEKGHAAFVEAAARIAPRHPDARFLIVGEGLQRADIEARVAAAGLTQRVRLLGHRDDLPAIWPALDLLAMTSLREGLPNVLLEAMLHGIPGVAMAVGGIPEVIDDGLDGLLVPAGDVDGFTARLGELLADAPRRARLGEAARAKVRDAFLFDARMRRMEALYDELLQGGRP